MTRPGGRVLLTGASGFIGRHVVARLVAEYADVVGLDLREWPDAPCSLRRVDIRNRKAMIDVFADVRPDVVVHLASLVGVRASVGQQESYRETNVEGTANLVHAAVENGVEHIVFSSSSSVYGATTPRPSRENDRLEPRSPYARSKIEAEQIVRGFPGKSTIARLFTVYGPGMRPDLALHRFIVAISNGRPITMLGDGQGRRDYTHVRDVSDGLAACLRRLGERQLTCNLGSGRATSLTGMIEYLEECIGQRAAVVEAPPHPADALHTCACLERAAEALGYAPSVRFEDGVRALVRTLTRELGAAPRTVRP